MTIEEKLQYNLSRRDKSKPLLKQNVLNYIEQRNDLLRDATIITTDYGGIYCRKDDTLYLIKGRFNGIEEL